MSAPRSRCLDCGRVVWLRKVAELADGRPVLRWVARRGTKGPPPIVCPAHPYTGASGHGHSVPASEDPR